jgi:O-acetyl-ADP-ribose deacetylase (regulator of RNase III)
VGPVWQGGDAGEAALLASCHRRSLEVADEIGARTVAFPAISTGVYSYPKDAAADIVVDTLLSVGTAVTTVTLCAFSDVDAERYRVRLAHD